MFELYLRPPVDREREATLIDLIRHHGGHLDFREMPTEGQPGGVCLSFEFAEPEKARRVADDLRSVGEHVEGPVDYGP